MMNNEKAKREKDKIFHNGTLNPEEIKHRIADHVADKAKFEKKWKLKPDDAEAFTGILSEWARHMNGNISQFLEREKGNIETRFNLDPNDPERMVDLSADAQLMRYTAGAGLAVNFKGFQGNTADRRDTNWGKRLLRGARTADFGIKANAEASLSLAEGKVSTVIYLPHFAGYHANADVGGQYFEFGYWRVLANIELSAGAGASLAVEADIAITLEGGVQRLRGTPRPLSQRAYARTKVGANAGLNVFAGAAAGVDLKGALQWLNPEGASKDGKPTAVKAGKAMGEYKDVAKVDSGVAGNAGIGVKGAFKIAFESGKFIIFARVGACLGLGCEGSLKFETGMDTINEFFKCISYQLKRADFHKIEDAIDKRTYEIYCQIKYLVIVEGKKIEEFVDKTLIEIESEFNDFVDSIDSAIINGSNEASEFLKNVKKEIQKKSQGWFSYAPPEVVGKILWQIQRINSDGNQALQIAAPDVMEMALGAPQTQNQLATIAERMTPVMGEKQDASAGFAMIQQTLEGSKFGNALEMTQTRLAGVEPRMSDPFIWNTDPEFLRSKIGTEHVMYA